MPKSTAVLSLVRPMVQADLECVLAWRNHLDVRRYMYTQHVISPDEHKRWFDRTCSNPKKHLLVFEMNQQPLGFLSFNETENEGIADWGFYAAPDAPKGSGRQLGRTGLSYAFSELELHKVCGQALPYNERSIQFHQSLGFQKEGVLREQHFDGERYHSVICFGLLRTEWQPTP